MYTSSQLAQVMGVSRRQVIRMVENAGMSWQWSGRKRFIYLSQLKEALPLIWDSLIATREVAHLIS
jgi:excisionase family DNA binding protein